MVMRISYSLLVMTLLFCPAASLAAQLKTVTDRTQTSLEESFTLELRVTGSIDGDPDLTVLDKDFELLGRSQSSQIQIINSDITRTTTWTLSLLARSAGKKQIPPLCIGNDCSDPVTIEVLPAGHARNASNSAGDMLLEVSTEPDKVRVQSQLLLKVRILTRFNFLQASLTEPEPSGVETVVQKLGEDRSYESERDGLRYRVIERIYALFPQESGKLTIPPIRFGAQVAEGGRDPYDPFNQRTRQLRKQSKEMTIEVLPAIDANGRNWLPASNLQLEDDWQRQAPKLTVGEPATRTLTLRASGLPSAQLPSLSIEIPDGVKSYPDQPSREDQFNENGVLGTLQQKLALVPTSPGNLRLPEIKVDWWDLQAERWQQALIPAIELEVLPAANQPGFVPTPPIEQTKSPKVDTEPQATTTTIIEPGFWPWLSLALGCGLLVTLFLLIKSKDSASGSDKKPTQEDLTLNLKASHRELQRALKSGNQAQIRSALIDWGTVILPKQRPGNLEELATLCGEPLKHQLEAFSKSLYSRSTEPWDGSELMAAVQQVEKDMAKKKSVDKLPPLYPRQ